MKKLSMLAAALTLISCVSAHCATLKDLLVPGLQIAVEKNTGRGDDYKTGFSGWVGSMSINIPEGIISISEFMATGGRLSVANGIYRITRIEEFDNNISFECMDITPLTHGIVWTGKMWLTDKKQLKIEMIQKQSPRRWVNLGANGIRFLRDNNLNLNLGY